MTDLEIDRACAGASGRFRFLRGKSAWTKVEEIDVRSNRLVIVREFSV